MCYKCIDRVNKLKQNVRRSNEPSATVTSQKVSESTSSNCANINGEENGLSQILSMLSKLDGKLSRINTSNDGIIQQSSTINLSETDRVSEELSTINQNVINLHAKVDHSLKMQSELDARNNSMMGKLDDLQGIINKSPAAKITKSTTTPGFSTSKKCSNKTLSSLDPFNWSFSFNQSITPNENSDLYQLLHGFEQNTWTSFDYLFKKLSESSDSLSHIETICKQLNNKNPSQQLCSPVTDSIILDNLCGINEKCDNIEKNLVTLDSHVKGLQSEEQTTQVLRSRYLELIDATTDGNDQPNDVGIQISNELIYTNDVPRHPTINDQFNTEQITNSANTKANDKQPIQQTVKNRLSYYVTKFAPNTTTETITDYLRDNGITNIESTKITCLLPRDKDRSLINFVSFKIDTNEDVARRITSPGFWPKKCSITEFIQKSVVDLTKGNKMRNTNFFQMPSQTINQR